VHFDDLPGRQDRYQEFPRYNNSSSQANLQQPPLRASELVVGGGAAQHYDYD